ncbi:MAG: hypothetical protein V1883_00775 [Candidatus Omnitrophota bacterium]
MAWMKNRRRRYLVNKKMQLQFTILLIMQAVIPTAILGSSIYVMHRIYQSSLQQLIGVSVNLNTQTQNMLYAYIVSLCLFLIISVTLLMFLGIRFTHHVAGPLYKLEMNIDKLAKGEKIEPIYFRKGDMVDNIADKFNIIAEKLNLLKH